MLTPSNPHQTRRLRIPVWSCLTVVVALAGSVRPVQAAPIYIESHGTTLYTIDSDTGHSTLIGPYGVTGVLAQAFGPDGLLYAMFNAGSPLAHLATVNTQTGAATPIGAATGVALQAMAFGPDGTLYAGSFTTNNLYKVSLSTGASTLIGSLGFNWIMDLAWDTANDTMYAIAAPPNCAGSSFYSIDLATGAGSLISNVSADNCLMALAADSSGRLFATGFMTTELYQIDADTGIATDLAKTGVGSTMGATVAPVPEPSSILVLGSGLAGLACMVRRKRRA